ncbi:MAG: hypothetical protein KDA89_24690, partial [Planctomycetaceae bacterium]|nr:hypothetical protein [Planctomycetaceae bacterium]
MLSLFQRKNGNAALPVMDDDVRRLIGPLRDTAASLECCRDDELQAECRHLKRQIVQGAELTSPEVLVAGLALVVESLKRTHGAELYDVQLYAALMLCRGCIAQMQTGEGKTFVAIATAAHLSMAGRGVHVMTPNSYLADRDCRLAERALQPLGLSAGLTRDQASPSDKQAAYDCDITYGTGHEF